MEFEQKEKMIQEYLTGDLSPEERQLMRKQIKSDPEMKELLEEYSLLFSDLKGLEHSSFPKDLWKRKIRPALEEHIERKETFWTRIGDFFSGFVSESMRPAIIAISFVIVIFAVTVVLQQQFFTDNSVQVSKSLEKIETLKQQFSAELNVLINEMEGRKELMPDTMREDYERTLAEIDEAIKAAERKYAIYSDDPEAIEQLMQAYNSKTEFLKTYLNFDL